MSNDIGILFLKLKRISGNRSIVKSCAGNRERCISHEQPLGKERFMNYRLLVSKCVAGDRHKALLHGEFLYLVICRNKVMILYKDGFKFFLVQKAYFRLIEGII